MSAGNSPEKQNATAKDAKNDMRKADPNSAYLTMKNGLDESIINSTTTNILGGRDIECSFFVCCQKLKNNILN